jgi:predicted O-methyltransferase YrrM
MPNLSPISAYYAHLASFDGTNPVIMDLAHIQLIGGIVLAEKPANILEIGIGTGFLSRTLLLACECNHRGTVTCVDNAHDWGGAAPAHFKTLSAQGANIVLADEHEFLVQDSGSYNLIVCDGDHTRTHAEAHRIFALAADAAFVFFHDTASPQFPNLRDIVTTARSCGFPHHEFTSVIDPTERTDRGLLMVINRRGQTWRTPWWLKARQALGRIRRGARRPA